MLPEQNTDFKTPPLMDEGTDIEDNSSNTKTKTPKSDTSPLSINTATNNNNNDDSTSSSTGTISSNNDANDPFVIGNDPTESTALIHFTAVLSLPIRFLLFLFTQLQLFFFPSSSSFLTNNNNNDHESGNNYSLYSTLLYGHTDTFEKLIVGNHENHQTLQETPSLQHGLKIDLNRASLEQTETRKKVDDLKARIERLEARRNKRVAAWNAIENAKKDS